MMARFDALISRRRSFKGIDPGQGTEFRRRYGSALPEARWTSSPRRIIEKGYDVNTVFEEVPR